MNWVSCALMKRGLRAPALVLAPMLGLLVACHHETPSDDARADGEKIFGNVCARCHGADGKGGIAAGGATAPRNFCDHAFQTSRSDQDLKTVIRKGKGGMPAFGDLFSDSDLDGLVLKLRAFDPQKQ